MSRAEKDAQEDFMHESITIAQRMCGDGFIICKDNRWGKPRTIIINLSDVSHIVVEEGGE